MKEDDLGWKTKSDSETKTGEYNFKTYVKDKSE